VNRPTARHRIIAGFSVLSALLLAILNEMCQRLVEAGLLQDRLVFDYVSDAMLVPIVACTLIAWRGHISIAAMGALATAFSLREIFSRLDPYDILTYWVSAVLIHLLLNRSAPES
jgi:hypothetical protein